MKRRLLLLLLFVCFLKRKRRHVLILLGRRREGKVDRTGSLKVGGEGIHCTDGGISLTWMVVHFLMETTRADKGEMVGLHEDR